MHTLATVFGSLALLTSPLSIPWLSQGAGLDSSSQTTLEGRDPWTPRPLELDIDGDGVGDWVLLHPSGALAAYRQGLEGLETLEVPALRSLPLLTGAALGDLDGDGTLDLLVSTRAGEVRLLVPDGAGDFQDVSEVAGLAHLEGVLGVRWHDIDGDQRDELLLSLADGFLLGRADQGVAVFQRLPVESSAFGFAPGPLAAPEPSPELPERGDGLPVPSAATDRLNGVSADSLDGDERAELDLTSGVRTSRAPLGGAPQPFPICAKGLDDPFGPECVQASAAVPTLGMLYPMTEALNVNAAGRVGIGTTNPTAGLDIRGTTGTNFYSQTTEGIAGVFSTGTINAPALLAGTPLSAGIAGRFNGTLNVGYNTGFPLFQDRTRVQLSHVYNAGIMRAMNSAGLATVDLDAEETDANGAQLGLSMYDGTRTITLDAEYGTSGVNGSRVSLFSRDGNETVEISSQEAVGNGAQIALSKANGTATIVLDAETARGCEVSLRNSLGVETIEMVTEEAAGNGAQILLRKADGSVGITLDAEYAGDGRIITEVLQITGGADLVEGFDTGGVDCPPGSVVVIDAQRRGQLTLSSEPYDMRVAGVVSGAGGVKPGLAMGQAGILDGDTQVALTGRVFVRCSTEAGPIQPGDLLTTSSTPGLAMRATDLTRANGAVLGKAMEPLADGEGLILVLVNLQ